jgi:(p)ppGpp synthase/HD superfamily hydrolase
MATYSERLRAALRLAEQAHRGQVRKGGDTPYILHPVAVTLLLVAAGADEDLRCAGLLHDVAEDSSVELAEIEERFGERVARLVGAVTERKVDEHGNKIPWDVRRAETIAHLERADDDVLALKAADLAANLGDVVMDHAEVGDALWTRFNAGVAAQLWYYQRVAEIVLTRGTLPLLAQEVRERLAELESLTATIAAESRSPRAAR